MWGKGQEEQEAVLGDRVSLEPGALTEEVPGTTQAPSAFPCSICLTASHAYDKTTWCPIEMLDLKCFKESLHCTEYILYLLNKYKVTGLHRTDLFPKIGSDLCQVHWKLHFRSSGWSKEATKMERQNVRRGINVKAQLLGEGHYAELQEQIRSDNVIE